MKHKLSTYKIGLVFSILAFLTGCTAQLAPLYDKAIVDNITTSNKEIMTLFASVSNGTTSSSFQTRADNYNKAIGSIDALEIQTKARPIPKSDIVEAVNEWLSKRETDKITEDLAPSAIALKGISNTLTKMRDTDSKQGLTSFEVMAFKKQTSIYMDQAITYESFLQR